MNAVLTIAANDNVAADVLDVPMPSVVNVQVVALTANGRRIAKTARGLRTYHVAFSLSSGDTMVSHRAFDSRHRAIYSAGRVLRNLESGEIHRDLTRWDDHELSMYAQFDVNGHVIAG